ncbi:Uncharacterised protein [Campylobacter hyointestinalis subsp. hyointestinalis]|nr:Uncharacterised protein [Campylobacter hyointestinalis subsp. hyointestinalis]
MIWKALKHKGSIMRAKEVLKTIKNRQRIKWAFSPFWVALGTLGLFIALLAEVYELVRGFYNECGGFTGFFKRVCRYSYKRRCSKCGGGLYPLSESEVENIIKECGDIELNICHECEKTNNKGVI